MCTADHASTDVDVVVTATALGPDFVAALTDILDIAVRILDNPLHLVNLGALADTAAACRHFADVHDAWINDGGDGHPVDNGDRRRSSLVRLVEDWSDDHGATR